MHRKHCIINLVFYKYTNTYAVENNFKCYLAIKPLKRPIFALKTTLYPELLIFFKKSIIDQIERQYIFSVLIYNMVQRIF